MPTIHINYEIGAPTSWVHYNRTYVPKAAHPRPMLLPWMRKTRGRQGGLCQSHYCQQLRTGSLWPLGSRRKLQIRCDFEGCDRQAVAQLLDNRPLVPLRERRGRHIDRGYVLIFEPKHPNARRDGYVAEHTKVMAARLGRPLERFEEVHHKNGIRHDNRL